MLKVLLPQIGLLRVSGVDAATYLQGQLSCDVSQVNSTHSSLGCYLNLKGRIIATFRLLFWQNCFWLRLPRECIPLLQKTVQHYALFSKVTISDVSDAFAVGGFVVSNPALPLETNAILEQGNKLVYALPQAFQEGRRYEVICPIEEIHTWYSTFEGTEITPNTWDLFDIEAGVPTVYQNTQEQFLPHAINYTKLGGVSFKKGCYLGQEIVARMEYRGHLKQQCYLVSWNGLFNFTNGVTIQNQDGQAIGEIIMTAQNAENEMLGLAVLNNQSAIDQAVQIENHAVNMRVINDFNTTPSQT